MQSIIEFDTQLLMRLDLKAAHCDNMACSSATTSTLDSAGIASSYTSVTIGGDGLGLISYHDSSADDLKVAHCDNPACTSATISTLDDIGNQHVGVFTSITTGADGQGLISYHRVWVTSSATGSPVEPA